MNPSRVAILAEMGLSPVWVRRDAPSVASGSGKAARTGLPAAAPQDRPSAAPAPAGTQGIAGMGWEELRQTILACRACGLCARRKQAVPGVGDENAAWLFIGEGPGAEEDARGEPFVGQAGRLLDAMLAAIGLKRGEDVYIANAVKCRPPGNRTPENAEMAACFPYLERQIALLRPRLIVLLGRAAVNAVLGEERSLASLRGKILVYHCGEREIPALATYHPAYLLRNLPDKAKAWEDLCRARALMRGLKQG
jgi:DNA polymerase